MKPFRISMEKGDGNELFGQGETLCEAFGNLVKAVAEFGDESDEDSVMDAAAELVERMPHPGPKEIRGARAPGAPDRRHWKSDKRRATDLF